jgi:hypothetical protein
MIETIFLILTVICIIFYLGGQIKNSHYTKSNTVYILAMLILTIIGYVVVITTEEKYPIASYGTVGLIVFTILVINIIEYAGINI